MEYSLFYGHDGVRIIGYDNERGKGDHRHYQAREVPYRFTTVKQMVSDFMDDVEQKRGSK